MYRPPAFAVEDEAWCFDFIKRYSFGTFHLGGLTTPMAFVADVERRVLFGHLARANPQAEMLLQGGAGTAFCLGPHGYVSPSVYAQPAVPTWNYTAVEMTGTVQVVEGKVLADWLNRLVAQEEAAIAGEWSTNSLAAGQMQKLQKAIIGFELSIQQIEGKAKLSQNKSAQDKAAVAAAFRSRGLAALADAMEVF